MLLGNANAAPSDNLALGSLRSGQRSLAKADYAATLAICKTGLAQLGDSYYDPKVVDDSGQKLVLAQIYERDGALKTAATIYCNVLSGRIQIMGGAE